MAGSAMGLLLTVTALTVLAQACGEGEQAAARGVAPSPLPRASVAILPERLIRFPVESITFVSHPPCLLSLRVHPC
jgi:hypothetical protein